MIEMNEQFQKEFGAAMAQLRAVVAGLTRSADNARGEAKALSANSDNEAAITAYEVAHAFWTAADRVRPVLGSFEDADRVAASAMEIQSAREELGARPHIVPEPAVTPEGQFGPGYAEIVKAELGVPFLVPIAGGQSLRFRVLYDGDGDITVGLFRDVPYNAIANSLGRARTDKGRVEFLEGELQRLNDALGGHLESTEDLVDLAIRKATSTADKARADREHERAESLAKVTTAAAKLLGVTTLPDILVALERLVTGKPFDFENLPQGSLISGEYVSAAGANRKIYVGRFVALDKGNPVIQYICDCNVNGGHVVTTTLNPATVRLPVAEEILAFSQLSRATGLLRLPDESDE